MTVKLISINKDGNKDLEIAIKLDDTRTMYLQEKEFKIVSDIDDGEPITRRYFFDDLEVMSDTINEINYPLYEQQRKMVAKIKKLKEENKELKSKIKMVSPEDTKILENVSSKYI